MRNIGTRSMAKSYWPTLTFASELQDPFLRNGRNWQVGESGKDPEYHVKVVFLFFFQMLPKPLYMTNLNTTKFKKITKLKQ